MIFHSIRWRILAWNFGLLAATAAVLLVAFYRHEKQARLQELDLRLRQEMTRGMGALNEVVPGVAGPRNPAPAARPNGKAAARGDSPEQRATKAKAALAEVVGTGVWVQVVDLDGKSLYRSANAPTEPELVTQALADLDAAQRRTPSLPLALALAQARQEQALPMVWNNQVWGGLDKTDDGLIWEIALFFEKKGLKEPAKKALHALQARPGWKDDPEWKAHWDAIGR